MSIEKVSSELLHYGSCISLALQDNTFMHSSGFIDTKLYLSSLENISDFSQCLFRVLPRCIRTVKNELISALETQSLSEYQAKYLDSEEKLEGEVKRNRQDYQKEKGKIIRFGTVVNLQHVESHKFITLYPKETGTADRDSFKIGLNDFPNELSDITLQPSYSFQKEGDNMIRMADIIHLEFLLPTQNKQVYLSASERLIEIELEVAKIQSKEINASLDNKSRWNINLFSVAQRDKYSCIRCGNYIWISHSEGAVVLVGSQQSENGADIYFDHNLTNSNGLWKIENERETMGGFLHAGRNYRLKHMSSGLYLSIKPAEDGKFVPRLSQKRNRSSLWIFEQIYNWKKDAKICSDQFCSLLNFKYAVKLQGLDFTDRMANIRVAFSDDSSESSYFKIFKPEENLLWESKFILNCIPLLESLPAFIEEYNSGIQCDPYNAIKKFIKKMEVAKACLEQIDLFMQNRLRSSVTIGKTKGVCDKIRQQFVKELSILDILSRILDCCFKGELSLDGEEGLADADFKNKSYLNHREYIDLGKDMKVILVKEIIQVVKLIYKVITTACKDNIVNQEYTFKFFQVFQKHAGNYLGATGCLESILANNETLLLKLEKRRTSQQSGISLPIIEYYVWLLRVIPK